MDGEYDMLDLEGAEYRPFFDVLASRFEMPPRAGLDGTPVASQAPYIIKVTLEDTEGCAYRNKWRRNCGSCVASRATRHGAGVHREPLFM